jgi:hypothetical protein
VAHPEELQELRALRPGLHAAIVRVLAAGGSPVVMQEYATALGEKFPGLSGLLASRVSEVVTRVVGRSGTTWSTWSAGPRPDGWIPVDVLQAPGCVPVLSYAQKGADPKKRLLIGIAPTADTRMLAAARQDFLSPG